MASSSSPITDPPSCLFVPPNRAADVRAAMVLMHVTLAWMVVEGGVSILLGVMSHSLLLEAFGIDSAIELFSACVLLWRLRVEAGGRADEARVEQVEHRASKWAGYALCVLAIYVLAGSAWGLWAHRLTDTRRSIWGVLVAAVAAVGMPILARAKLKIAARLGSSALRADAMEAITCGYLSIVVLAGLVATRLGGWWWLDSVAAVVLVPLLVKEGREAVRGECSCRQGRD